MEEVNICLGDFIERQAVLHPERPALMSRGGQITYGDLVVEVNAEANWLLGLGVVRETRVAICADRSFAWIIGALAVLRSGGVYIPVDPMAPLPRKVRILQDTGVQLLLMEQEPFLAVPEGVRVATLQIGRKTSDSTSRMQEILPDQAAYGIYTSGSAGAPKSVIVSHRSLANYARVLRRELMLTVSDRYLHTASLAFSASIRQLVAPLVCGSTVVIATRDQIRDPPRLIAWMVETGVTVFDTVPSYLVRWLAAVVDSPRDWREGLKSSLRLVLSTGEPLPAAVVNSLHTEFPTVRILNLYGQTETTGTIAIHEALPGGPSPVPIGKPLDPCRFYVLDDQLEPVSEGELCVSGPCLARGYLGRPDITATNFIADPFSPIPGSRIYRTGDRVQVIENGLLLFKGRMDNQVKVHGVRVELDEINASLLAHPGVLEAATVLRLTGETEPRLISFVVKRPHEMSYSAEDLRGFLAVTLPEPMLPGIIVFIDELPRTASGKVDRPALMLRDIPPPERKTSGVIPRTETERLVAACWEEALQVSGISVHDDFFELGGDSLQAVLMFLRLQKMLPTPLTLGTLFFQDPTVHAFASAIDAELAAAV